MAQPIFLWNEGETSPLKIAFDFKDFDFKDFVVNKKQALKIAELYAEAVAKEFSPKQILLFGSYLDGTPHEYSDIDIAVVYDKYPDHLTWWDGATRLTSLCWEVNVAIEPHLMELDDDPWGVARKVVERGT